MGICGGCVGASGGFVEASGAVWELTWGLCGSLLLGLWGLVGVVLGTNFGAEWGLVETV